MKKQAIRLIIIELLIFIGAAIVCVVFYLLEDYIGVKYGIFENQAYKAGGVTFTQFEYLLIRYSFAIAKTHPLVNILFSWYCIYLFGRFF